MSSLLCLPLIAILGACAPDRAPTASMGEPSFYVKLSAPDVQIDPFAARDMISIHRHNHGLGPVRVDPALQRAAQAQVEAMVKANELSHTVGGTLMLRLDAAGAAHEAAVENISAGYATLAEAFSGWRQSPSHDANMLDARVTRMGIATAYAPGSRYGVYWALVMTD